MKQLLLVMVVMLPAVLLRAQLVEYSVHFNSGLFHYTGNDAIKTTFLNILSSPGNSATGYPNERTGRLNGFSYGASFSIQKVTKCNFIFGIDAGWESLASKVQITSAWTDTSYYDAKGSVRLRNTFINSFPFAGYRFKIKNVTIDAIAGPETAGMLSSAEKGNAIITGTHTKVSIDGKGDKPSLDLTIRWRAQLNIWYKKWGLNAGYSYDLTNYYHTGYTGGQPIAYGRYLRLGFSYKIK